MKCKETEWQLTEKINFAKVVNEAPIGIIVHRWDTEVVYANPTALSMLGLNYQQLIGASAVDPRWHFINQQHERLHVSEFPVYKVKLSGHPLVDDIIGVVNFELNTTRWFKVNASKETPDGDDSLGFIIVSLIELDGGLEPFSYKQILHNAQDIIVVTEAQDIDSPTGPKIVYVNKAFEQLTGYTSQEVIGETPRILQGKGTDPIARERIRAALKATAPVRETLLNYSKTGKPYFLEMNIIPLENKQGVVTHFAAIERDVTQVTFQAEQMEKRNTDLKLLKDNLTTLVRQRTIELEQANTKLHKLAYFDSLTNIANRRSFFEMGQAYLSLSRRKQQIFAIAMLDIDNFKAINDNFGHKAGDACLILLASTMKVFFRAEDLVARVGGEEFALAMLFEKDQDIEATLLRFQHYLADSFNSDDKIGQNTPKPFTVSIGVCVVDTNEKTSFDELLSCADQAMYDVKKSGKNSIRIKQWQ